MLYSSSDNHVVKKSSCKINTYSREHHSNEAGKRGNGRSSKDTEMTIGQLLISKERYSETKAYIVRFP